MRVLIQILGSGLGSGLLPKMPGTWGSLLATLIISIPLWVHRFELFLPVLLAFLGSSLLLHYLVAPSYLKQFGNDAPSFVLDEWVGQAIVLLAIIPLKDSVGFNLTLTLLAFILFRFFDILKPLGIDHLQQMKGQFGVLIDDVAAGTIAYLCLKTLIFLVF